jgi:Cyclophilin-like family
MSHQMTRRAFTVLAPALAMFPRLAMGQTEVNEEKVLMRIRITFGREDFTATLFDNASSRELAAMLPLDLTIDDFANNEKIAYLPRKLSELTRVRCRMLDRGTFATTCLGATSPSSTVHMRARVTSCASAAWTAASSRC